MKLPQKRRRWIFVCPLSLPFFVILAESIQTSWGLHFLLSCSIDLFKTWIPQHCPWQGDLCALVTNRNLMQLYENSRVFPSRFYVSCNILQVNDVMRGFRHYSHKHAALHLFTLILSYVASSSLSGLHIGININSSFLFLVSLFSGLSSTIRGHSLIT